MDVHILLGWDDEDAFNMLNNLKVIPQHPVNDDEYDPHEFCVSNAGIIHINNELNVINNRFGTSLEWRMYPGNHFVLAWRDELVKSIGDPEDAPVGKFLIDHHKGHNWHGIAEKFDWINPIVIAIVDAEVFYHKYIYCDSDNSSD